MKSAKWMLPLAWIAMLAFGAATSQGQDRKDFLLVNNTGASIREIYVSPHESGWWGADVLGTGVLRNGYQTVIQFNPFVQTSCFYDFKLVYTDGYEQTYGQGWDLCRIYAIRFRSDELLAY